MSAKKLMAQWNVRPLVKMVALVLFAGISGWALGQAHPAVSGAGEEIYNKQCAACHEHPDATRAPAKSALNAMTGAAIRYALTQGNMKVQGSNLTPDQRAELINYLTLGGRSCHRLRIPGRQA